MCILNTINFKKNIILTLLFLLLLFDTPTCQMQSRVAMREKIAFALAYVD